MASAAVGGVTTYFGVNGLGQRIVKRGANVLGAFGYRYGSSGHMLLRQRIPRTTAAALSGQIEYMYDEAGHLIGEYDQTAGPLEETVYLGDTPVAVLQGTGASAAIYAVSADNIDAPHIIAANSGTPSGPGITRRRGDPPEPEPLRARQLHLRSAFSRAGLRPEYGLSYNGARDYNAALGRYVESDPIGLAGGINTYQYIASNPLSFKDPSGTQLVAPLPVAPPLGTSDPGSIDSASQSLATAIQHLFDRNTDPYSGTTFAALKPLDSGGAEFGRRRGCGADAGRRAAHAVKKADNMSKATNRCQIDPNTGDVYDPEGNHVGNAGDYLGNN